MMTASAGIGPQFTSRTVDVSERRRRRTTARARIATIRSRRCWGVGSDGGSGAVVDMTSPLKAHWAARNAPPLRLCMPGARRTVGNLRCGGEILWITRRHRASARAMRISSNRESVCRLPAEFEGVNVSSLHASIALYFDCASATRLGTVTSSLILHRFVGRNRGQG